MTTTQKLEKHQKWIGKRLKFWSGVSGVVKNITTDNEGYFCAVLDENPENLCTRLLSISEVYGETLPFSQKHPDPQLK